jgi:hypothetical protein
MGAPEMLNEPFSMKHALAVNVSGVLLVGAAFMIPNVWAGDKQGEAQAKGSLVHCLLPSSVRKYAGDAVRLAPRRVVQSTAAECQQQGGEVVVVEPAN